MIINDGLLGTNARRYSAHTPGLSYHATENLNVNHNV